MPRFFLSDMKRPFPIPDGGDHEERPGHGRDGAGGRLGCRRRPEDQPQEPEKGETSALRTPK